GAEAGAAGHRRRRAAAGPARSAVELPRVARRRRVEAGVLRRHRLAEEDGPRLTQPPHDRGVLAGDAVGPQARTGGGRPVEDVEDVLDADGNAVQRAAPLAAPQFVGEPFRLGAGVVPIDEDPGPDALLRAVDALQALLDEIDGGEFALADGL